MKKILLRSGLGLFALGLVYIGSFLYFVGGGDTRQYQFDGVLTEWLPDSWREPVLKGVTAFYSPLERFRIRWTLRQHLGRLSGEWRAQKVCYVYRDDSGEIVHERIPLDSPLLMSFQGERVITLGFPRWVGLEERWRNVSPSLVSMPMASSSRWLNNEVNLDVDEAWESDHLSLVLRKGFVSTISIDNEEIALGLNVNEVRRRFIDHYGLKQERIDVYIPLVQMDVIQ